ncbi:MAG: efflux RND transporter periplasmic adaptor subunit [Verrucomicrobiaceae bacterium]|nr:efflux RND transporter periplasmic adaptor subunit [Verrucomicrobiaceae bacterium]
MARPSAIARFFVFLATSCVVGGGAWLFWKKQTEAPSAKAAAPKAPGSVTTASVKKDNYATDIEAIGTVLADESTSIMPNVTETVTALSFDDGSVVKKGDLLATLSDAEEQATLASAKFSLAEEEREIARLTALVKDGAAPEAKLQERQTMAEVARQKIREAEAKLADRRIVAPFDGVLGLRRISVGALVSPTTVITTLDKIDVVKIDFSVPETTLPHLKMGTEISAHAAGAREKAYTGKLSQLDSRIDSVTRSVSARAEVPNPGHELKPGMLVNVRLAMEPRLSLSIPERSLVPVGAKAFVFTIDNGKAKRIEVKTGRRKPGFLEVIDGVTEGQTIIADGLVGLQDGMAVKVTGEFAGPVAAFNPEQNAK